MLMLFRGGKKVNLYEFMFWHSLGLTIGISTAIGIVLYVFRSKKDKEVVKR